MSCRKDPLTPFDFEIHLFENNYFNLEIKNIKKRGTFDSGSTKMNN